MNFIDAYDVSGTQTPPVSNADGDQQPQSLNDEVSQVIGSLNRFWGGFRKQETIETARKDFGQVVEQAQKELTKLNTPAATEPEGSTASATTPTDSAERSKSDPSDEPDGNATPKPSTTEIPPESSSSFTPQSLFTRFQSSLPPNIVATVQSHIPPLDSIRHAASESIDFAQLRTTLTSEFQRVQGVTLAQAEEYVQKSEGLLREAVKEAGDFIKEAVKVVPPEQLDHSVGVVWDGSDVWMLPSAFSESSSTGGKGKEKEGERSSGEARRSVATRAEALLKRLRHDPEVLHVDPETDEGVKALYDEWLEREVEGKGGIQSSEWLEKRNAAYNLLEDEAEFKALQSSLVPSTTTEDVFWTRYFFRAYQIDREAERRKALLQGTSESEDEFKWEDDEEEPTSPKDTTSSAAKAVPSEPAAHATPVTLSPRESEESYDVVSDAPEEIHPKLAPAPIKKPEVEEESDEDEDEDDEEEEEEEEEEEGGGDSDWE